MKICILIMIACFCCSCASQRTPPETVKTFDTNLYAGEWHEIARLPNFFERNLVAARATYGLNKDGTLSIHNEGLKADGKRTSIKGSATPVSTGKLKIRFNKFPANLFTGDYWVLEVDPSYQHAIVGSPNRKYLWLLAKDPNKKAEDFSESFARIKGQGFELDMLIENPKRVLD